ncbi:hypothetical protein MH117_14665 [Paenibacillus sp. ACRRX]|uniref:hypothetical protein n=1 Tax=Paenibacillus sp. ACRRX TaxID=2918206 RepID=UPI001EF6DF31|nr:hypothetical protein [Paenibacillus sp. ACRRX]MCG7408671.1 hypothetical protein [Paenibacillus sp. ACRRX]
MNIDTANLNLIITSIIYGMSALMILFAVVDTCNYFIFKKRLCRPINKLITEWRTTLSPRNKAIDLTTEGHLYAYGQLDTDKLIVIHYYLKGFEDEHNVPHQFTDLLTKIFMPVIILLLGIFITIGFNASSLMKDPPSELQQWMTSFTGYLTQAIDLFPSLIVLLAALLVAAYTKSEIINSRKKMMNQHRFIIEDQLKARGSLS